MGHFSDSPKLSLIRLHPGESFNLTNTSIGLLSLLRFKVPKDHLTKWLTLIDSYSDAKDSNPAQLGHDAQTLNTELHYPELLLSLQTISLIFASDPSILTDTLGPKPSS